METKLRKMRQARELTQVMVAAASDMGWHAYNKKELGLRKVSAREAVILSRVLGCSVEDITED